MAAESASALSSSEFARLQKQSLTFGNLLSKSKAKLPLLLKQSRQSSAATTFVASAVIDYMNNQCALVSGDRVSSNLSKLIQKNGAECSRIGPVPSIPIPDKLLLPHQQGIFTNFVLSSLVLSWHCLDNVKNTNVVVDSEMSYLLELRFGGTCTSSAGSSSSPPLTSALRVYPLKMMDEVVPCWVLAQGVRRPPLPLCAHRPCPRSPPHSLAAATAA